MKPPCKHCGAPVPASAPVPEFCCGGCQFVWNLIHEQKLDAFYQLTSGSITTPQSSLVFHARDYRWLSGLAAAAEQSPTAELRLGIQGISCGACVWLIERLFLRMPGSISARVDSTSAEIYLRWESGKCDLAAYAAQLQKFGYLVGPAGVATPPPMRNLTLRMGIAAALALNVMLFSLPSYLGMEATDQFADLFSRICAVLASLSIAIGGSYFFQRSFHSLRAGYLHMDLPISLGLIAAYAGSMFAWLRNEESFLYFDFVSIFTFLMLAGRWTQQRAVLANRNHLLQMAIRPGPVDVEQPDGTLLQTPAENLSYGDIFHLPSGAHVPVRASLLNPQAGFGLAWINGESEPGVFRAGALIPAGAANLEREPVRCRAAEAWPDSQLARLLRIETRPEAHNDLMEKIIRYYLLAVLGISAMGFAIWWHSAGLYPALQVAISILIVSCPCAAGVAVPLAQEMVVAGLRRRGVYVRVHDFWQRLARVRKIIFDKTGTLTLETLVLTNRDALTGLSSAHRQVLWSMVAESLHPVAACLREELLTHHDQLEPLRDCELSETTGMGIELRQGDNVWRLGRPEWAGGEGGTAFTLNAVALCSFHFAEHVRPEARQQTQALLQRGFEVFLLSGDRAEKAAKMAAELGIPREHAFGALSPEDKAAWVARHAAADGLMFGDGANDSLAFDQALCCGTPAIDRGLLEHKADFFLTGRSLAGIGALFACAELRRKVVRRVFAFAVGYNSLAISACLAGWMSPLVAAIIMPASSLVSIGLVWVTLNSHRGTDSIEQDARLSPPCSTAAA